MLCGSLFYRFYGVLSCSTKLCNLRIDVILLLFIQLHAIACLLVSVLEQLMLGVGCSICICNVTGTVMK